MMEHSRNCEARPSGQDLVARTNAIREILVFAPRAVDAVAITPASQMPDQPVSELEVREMLRMRRERAQFFDADLFADPAWDMLLELYAAQLGQQRISIGVLCIRSAVPPTTALRWINTLENRGLAERRADPLDGRRFHSSLSTKGSEAMKGYFQKIAAHAPIF